MVKPALKIGNHSFELFLCLFLLFLFFDCDRQPIAPITEKPQNYVPDFNQVWTDFDQNYSYFEFKQIDWAEIKNQFEPLVQQEMIYSAFIQNVLLKMLEKLQDDHVTLTTKYGETLQPFQTQFLKNYGYDQTFGAYFQSQLSSTKPDTIITHAFINDSLAYLRIRSWRTKYADEILQFHVILEKYARCRALVIDVRSNSGGAEELARQIAGRFTSEEKIYAYHQFRNGPAHSDFTEMTPRTFGPTGDWQFLKPVAVLIGQECASANEHFIAMMSTLDQLISVGDTTRGCTGKPCEFSLKDGTRYTISNWISYKLDQTPLQNTGLFPDFPILSNRSLLPNRDLVLEKALEELFKRL